MKNCKPLQQAIADTRIRNESEKKSQKKSGQKKSGHPQFDEKVRRRKSQDTHNSTKLMGNPVIRGCPGFCRLLLFVGVLAFDSWVSWLLLAFAGF